MRVTVDLGAALEGRLEGEAVRRGVTMESLVIDAVDRAFPPSEAEHRQLAFIGSGEGPADLSNRHKQIRRDLAAGRGDGC
jgi:hypothetical protein